MSRLRMLMGETGDFLLTMPGLFLLLVTIRVGCFFPSSSLEITVWAIASLKFIFLDGFKLWLIDGSLSSEFNLSSDFAFETLGVSYSKN